MGRSALSRWTGRYARAACCALLSGVECQPKRIVLVDSIQERHRELAFEVFGLPPENRENTSKPLRPEPGTIYVLAEFENNQLVEDLHTTDTWVLGPTCLAELVSDSSLGIRPKPLYSTSMLGLCIYINCPGSTSLMKRLVRLIKWMGGQFTRQPNRHVTHMITDSVLAGGYRYCATFRVPVLSPRWVEHSWDRRHTVGFKALSTMDGFKLATFAGLSICFMGFDLAEYVKVEVLTKNNGGAIVGLHDSNCTHVVIKENTASQVYVEDIPPAFVVSSSWFWSSLEQNQRDDECYYSCETDLCFTKEVTESSRICDSSTESDESLTESSRELNTSELSTSEDVQSADYDAQKKIKKRKQLYQELYETEKNYLKCLKNLMKMKSQLMDSDQKGGAILSESQSSQLFANAGKLFWIHQHLVQQLEKVLQSDMEISQVILDFKNDLNEEYTVFAKQHDTMTSSFRRQLEKNRRFRKYVDSLAREPKADHPKDLFMRPIQRIVHIREILNRLRNLAGEEPDKELLSKATETIETILENMNNSSSRSNG